MGIHRNVWEYTCIIGLRGKVMIPRSFRVKLQEAVASSRSNRNVEASLVNPKHHKLVKICCSQTRASTAPQQSNSP